MKILWLSHNIPYPPKTGVLQRNYNLIREASKIGSVHLVAVQQRNVIPGDNDLELARSELLKLCKEVHFIDLPIDRSRIVFLWTLIKSMITAQSFTMCWLDSQILRKAIREIVNINNFDVVHFDTVSLAVFLDEVDRKSSILNHHNMESHLYQERSRIENNFFKKKFYHLEGTRLERYERDNCGKFRFNFTVSKEDCDILQANCVNADIRVIPNGVDVEYFHMCEGSPKDENLIIVGGMNWYPNRDAVVYMVREIWPRLKRDVPGVSLTVVGASPPKQLLDAARDDDSFEVAGFVDDVRPYMEKADIYLCPMRDGGGTRLKILDALSMGKAIVSTRKGVEGITVVEDQHYLLAESPEEFTTQIKKLLGNRELKDRLVIAGRKMVEEEYSWPVIGKELNKIYVQIVDGK